MNVAEAVKEPLQTPMEASIEIPQGKEIYLFVCSGNTCRSPMAAALFNHYYGSSDRTADSTPTVRLCRKMPPAPWSWQGSHRQRTMYLKQ